MASDPFDPTCLGTHERALVLAALVHHGAAAPAVLGRLTEPAATRLAASARRLAELPGAARAAALAREAARLFAPLPPGLARVHPSWLAAAVADAPAALRESLLAALPPACATEVRARLGWDGPAPAAAGHPPAPVVTWLRRRAFGGLSAMPEGDAPDAAPALEELPRCPLAVIEARLLELGRARVATALRGAPRTAFAALCARLAADEAAALVAAVRASDDATGAKEALHEITELCAGQGPLDGGGRELLLRAGARQLGKAAAGRGDLPCQLAQRLPLDLGRVLLAAAGEPPHLSRSLNTTA